MLFLVLKLNQDFRSHVSFHSYQTFYLYFSCSVVLFCIANVVITYRLYLLDFWYLSFVDVVNKSEFAF